LICFVLIFIHGMSIYPVVPALQSFVEKNDLGPLTKNQLS